MRIDTRHGLLTVPSTGLAPLRSLIGRILIGRECADGQSSSSRQSARRAPRSSPSFSPLRDSTTSPQFRQVYVYSYRAALSSRPARRNAPRRPSSPPDHRSLRAYRGESGSTGGCSSAPAFTRRTLSKRPTVRLDLLDRFEDDLRLIRRAVDDALLGFPLQRSGLHLEDFTVETSSLIVPADDAPASSRDPHEPPRRDVDTAVEAHSSRWPRSCA